MVGMLEVLRSGCGAALVGHSLLIGLGLFAGGLAGLLGIGGGLIFAPLLLWLNLPIRPWRPAASPLSPRPWPAWWRTCEAVLCLCDPPL